MGSSKQQLPAMGSHVPDPPKLSLEIPSGALDFSFLPITEFTELEPRTAQPISANALSMLGTSSKQVLSMGTSSTSVTSTDVKSPTNIPTRPRASTKDAPQISALPKTETITPWDFISPISVAEDELWQDLEKIELGSKMSRNNAPQVKTRKTSQLSITTRMESSATTPMSKRESLFDPSHSKSPSAIIPGSESPKNAKENQRQSYLKGIAVSKEEKLRKCIRVYDASDNSVMIDVSTLQDGKSIRERIVSKITHSHQSIEDYTISTRTAKATFLNDSQLFEVCNSSENQDRNNLYICRSRKEEEDVFMSSPNSSVRFSPSLLPTPSGTTPTSAMRLSLSKPAAAPAKDERSKRCIRIFDKSSNSFWIDISYALDATAVREKIGLKLGHSTNAAIPIMYKKNTEEELVNDELLMQICTNSEHPLRMNLVADINRTAETAEPSPRRARTLSSSSKNANGDSSFKRTSFLKSITSPGPKSQVELEEMFDEKLKVNCFDLEMYTGL
jgi:hypothetical protein